MKQISTLEIQCANTSDETGRFNSWVQLFSKMDLSFEIQKTNVGIRINILERPGVPKISQRTTLTFSAQICPKINFAVRISKI